MTEIPQKYQKIRQLDEIDCKILNLLVENSRIRLIDLARRVGLSMDSTKKRMMKLVEDGVITKYTIQVDFGVLGTRMGVHVYIKLKDLKEGDYENLIQSLKKDPKVIDLISMIGDYDLYVVMIADNAQELEKRRLKIRQQFSNIIADWKEVITAELHKLEEYSF